MSAKNKSQEFKASTSAVPIFNKLLRPRGMNMNRRSSAVREQTTKSTVMLSQSHLIAYHMANSRRARLYHPKMTPEGGDPKNKDKTRAPCNINEMNYYIFR